MDPSLARGSAIMSKFRARALDATRALPVYRSDDIPELAEHVAMNRSVSQMPTGMEKEEESVSYFFLFSCDVW